ncbi:FitA-like ribbon-helix-helix domain-containing protein [Paraherbaspirillum soli]|uniref:Plasmid stabilization protein n=1 Tax=Paraherbaspirillum soli TaxID=631222 RepID=A0ABW0M7Y4_9BURK
MATLTIRNFDDDLKARLRIEAALHQRSMEEEVRVILRRALTKPNEQGGIGSRIHQRFAVLGGAELDLPERQEKPCPADLPE